MAVNEIFRVNYYVSGMLAQGGNLWLDTAKICFSPTSALDRALGAKNVDIPFLQIQNISQPGTLSRTIQITVPGKVHRFEGGQAKRIWELLEKVLPNKGVMAPLGSQPAASAAPAPRPAASPSHTGSLACDHCSKPIQPGYNFCPHCASRLKAVCLSCSKSVDPTWAACAYCGRRISATA